MLGNGVTDDATGDVFEVVGARDRVLVVARRWRSERSIGVHLVALLKVSMCKLRLVFTWRLCGHTLKLSKNSFR